MNDCEESDSCWLLRAGEGSSVRFSAIWPEILVPETNL